MSLFSSDEPLNTERKAPNQSAWTPMRLKLRSWFQANVESLAPAYEGAVELLGDSRFPGRTHFIAHAVRDIVNGLPFALDQQLNGGMVQYANIMDRIQEEWKSPKQVLQEAAPGADGFTIPMNVATHIDNLVEEHRASRKRPSRYELLFRILVRNAPSTVTLDARTIKAFKTTSKWFVGRAHFPRRPLLPVDEQQFVWRFEEFERAIYVLVESLSEGGFFAGIGELDDILQQANQ